MSQPPPPAPLQLIPTAGLCNRLRAIASAVCAAREAGRPLQVFWMQQLDVCVGAPKQLFHLETTPIQVLDAGFWRIPPIVHGDCLTLDDWNRFSFRFAQTPIVIKSHGVFWQKDKTAWLEALRSIQPAPMIRAAVDNLFEPIEHPLVGVHIRRTDHKKAIVASPTKEFMRVMDTYPATQHFFLATDDLAERATIAAAYPGRIHFIRHPLDRNTAEGATAAMADFLALSRCSEILGSAHSSFSEIAATYGGCPLRVVSL